VTSVTGDGANAARGRRRGSAARGCLVAVLVVAVLIVLALAGFMAYYRIAGHHARDGATHRLDRSVAATGQRIAAAYRPGGRIPVTAADPRFGTANTGRPVVVRQNGGSAIVYTSFHVEYTRTGGLWPAKDSVDRCVVYTLTRSGGRVATRTGTVSCATGNRPPASRAPWVARSVLG
jgi:hypothetical protein